MKELVTKLTKAALAVGGSLKADKKNLEQKYDYLSADKILSICGQALFAQGIAVIPQVNQKDFALYEYTDYAGKPKKRYDASVVFDMTISDGDNTIKLPWVGMGSDYSVPDKALYKAITSGHKYFLMKLLCIGEGNEDGEHDPDDNGKEDKKQQQPTKTQPATPEPPSASTEPVKEIITTKNGERYEDLQTKDLAARATELTRDIKAGKYTGEKPEMQAKLDKIRQVLAARNKTVTE